MHYAATNNSVVSAAAAAVVVSVADAAAVLLHLCFCQLFLISFCSCHDCHDHCLHYAATNNSVVSAAAAAVVVSVADAAAVLLCLPFCQLFLFSYCSCHDCHDHCLHYTGANNSVVSAAAAAAVVSAADADVVLLHLPFCHLSAATFLSTSSGGLGHMMSLYCSGKYCHHLLYSLACLIAGNCIGAMGSDIDASHSLR